MIEVSSRLGPDEANIVRQVLMAPGQASEPQLQYFATTLHKMLCEATLESRSTHCSLLGRDVDSLGPPIFESGSKFPRVLLAEWVTTQRIAGLCVSNISHRFFEVSPQPFLSLALIEPRPHDYEPVLRRILTHIESAGLEQITVVTGVIKRSWVEQLTIQLDGCAEVIVRAMAIVDDDYPIDDYLASLSATTVAPDPKGLPRLIAERMGC